MNSHLYQGGKKKRKTRNFENLERNREGIGAKLEEEAAAVRNHSQYCLSVV